MTQALNVMPVPTWNKLKVNSSEKRLFKIANKLSDFKNKKKTIQGKVSELKTVYEMFDKIETAVGIGMTDFINLYKNDTNYLKVNGNDNLIELSYYLDTGDFVLVDDTKIIVENDSKAVVIQTYTSDNEIVGKHAGQTKVILKANAELELIQVQMFNRNTQHFSDIGIEFAENAKASVIRVDMGAKTVVSGCLATLAKNNADFMIDSLYYGDYDRSFDFNDIARHIGRRTNSVIKAQGALFDECKKVYRGTIDFKKGSAKSVGDESENTMVFGLECVNKSAPLILCAEDDVEGHHAASIGRIDEGLMFYMQTRGFSQEEIRQMMIESSFAPTVAKIPNEALQKEILAFL